MFLKKTALAVGVIAALALSGCASGGEGATGENTSLTIATGATPVSLDPAAGGWANRAVFYQPMFDTLLLTAADGTIEPFLATEWQYDESNTQLTLTIRDDVEFSDGEKLDAAAVKANLERFKTGSSGDASFLRNVATVEAPDATTVVITLSEPDPGMLSYLSRTPGLIASPASFDDPEIATNPVGSGPYVFDADATVIGTSYVYTANPDYWAPELQHYDTITVNVLADPTAALNAIKAGEADAVQLPNNDNLAEIEASGWTINGAEVNFQGVMLFDRDGVLAPELADVRVRQAINHAFDREGLMQALQGGVGTVTGQVFPERSVAYDPELDDRYPYDPERAKELLAEAGYPNGFTLSMPNSATLLPPTTFTLVTQALGDIGITTAYTDPGNNFISDIIGAKFPASFFALEQNPDWQLIEFMIGQEAMFNPFGTMTPEAQALIDEIQVGDEQVQEENARALNEYIVEQAWFAPWYRSQQSMATAPGTSATMGTNVFPNIYDIRPSE